MPFITELLFILRCLLLTTYDLLSAALRPGFGEHKESFLPLHLFDVVVVVV